ncbi:hypothetical protein B0T17DRAFT_544911 [Bombardia bombarda]|uniref:Uncharacterized protein n=1 Tax=Bombardia bombarda TaxID=252184 RepID=A0AA39TRS1_9PEZI|nr:hypothetical protein B0T17DRAFT_544911 [Bombardia bombarda]
MARQQTSSSPFTVAFGESRNMSQRLVQWGSYVSAFVGISPGLPTLATEASTHQSSCSPDGGTCKMRARLLHAFAGSSADKASQTPDHINIQGQLIPDKLSSPDLIDLFCMGFFDSSAVVLVSQRSQCTHLPHNRRNMKKEHEARSRKQEAGSRSAVALSLLYSYFDPFPLPHHQYHLFPGLLVRALLARLGAPSQRWVMAREW